MKNNQFFNSIVFKKNKKKKNWWKKKNVQLHKRWSENRWLTNLWQIRKTESCRNKHKNSEINTFLSRFSRNKYCLIIDSSLFSSSLTKKTNLIFVSCNGLTDAKETVVNGKSIKVLGVVNINQIESWDKLKGKKKW